VVPTRSIFHENSGTISLLVRLMNCFHEQIPIFLTLSNILQGFSVVEIRTMYWIIMGIRWDVIILWILDILVSFSKLWHTWL